MDIYVSFWKAVSELANKRVFYSIDKVKEEIEKGKDELIPWIKANLPKGFFINMDSAALAKYADVINWANSRGGFKPDALATFADVADAYLIAVAAAHNMTLVTNEKSNPANKKRVMIPDACIAIGVPYCDLNSALRNLNVKI